MTNLIKKFMQNVNLNMHTNGGYLRVVVDPATVTGTAQLPPYPDRQKVKRKLTGMKAAAHLTLK